MKAGFQTHLCRMSTARNFRHGSELPCSSGSEAIIFHHPLPITSEGASGSRVRPYRMLQAFCSLGYEVEVVAGYAADRGRKMRRLREENREGRCFAFAYAESSTMPTVLTEPHHIPVRPFLDFGFFRWLKGTYVPLGLFYRDVYWRLDHYRRQVAGPKWAAAVLLYHHEWRQFRRWVDHLFLPSLSMRDALPSEWPGERVSALPPGCDVQLTEWHPGIGNRDHLQLFYVGGVSPPLYDLRGMVEAVQAVNGVSLTLCCRADEWSQIAGEYPPTEGTAVRVLHTRGDALASYYSGSAAFLLFRRPDPYLDFAMPVKVFEALGFGLPLITGAGTAVARFVEREQLGWVVRTQEELRDLLTRLRDHPQELTRARERVRVARERHTWEVRARTVAEVLTGYRDSKGLSPVPAVSEDIPEVDAGDQRPISGVR